MENKKLNLASLAGASILLNQLLEQDLLTHDEAEAIMRKMIRDNGFSLDNFKRCISVSNFSVICDLVANNKAITFAYEPISRCRNDLATFSVADMQISGEFNFVYCNERIAKDKIELFFGK